MTLKICIQYLKLPVPKFAMLILKVRKYLELFVTCSYYSVAKGMNTKELNMHKYASYSDPVCMFKIHETLNATFLI